MSGAVLPRPPESSTCSECGKVTMAGERVRRYRSCRSCRAEYDRSLRAANPGKFRERQRNRYAANREKILEQGRARRAANPEKREQKRERDRAVYAADREKGRGLSRERRYRLKYGLTLARRDAMLAAQGGKCANARCGAGVRFIDATGSRRGGACVDHCHATGRVRAILCSTCNTALGMARDSTAVLAGLIDYLHRHPTTDAGGCAEVQA